MKEEGKQLKVIRCENYDTLSKKAAQYVIEKVKQNPSLTLGLATGATPKKMYAYMVDDYFENKTSYEQVKCFNLDEYVGVSRKSKNSYYQYMKENLYQYIDVQEQHTFIPNGTAENLEKECEMYEQQLADLGGVDLQILGIGENGHIGFNEPGTSFHAVTHVVKLAESTRKANSRYFSSLEEVPTHAITMGLETIMKSKEILLLISGENKAEAFRKLMDGEITTDFPASILRNHPNVTVLEEGAKVEV